MNKAILFTKRNLKEMKRDPLVYIFCAGFPIAMVLLFQRILHYAPDGKVAIFEVKSLIPGIMVFSYSLLMLMSSLLISKDKSTAFLKRLYTSPMKGKDYIIGYFIPFFIIGLIQSVICILLGYIFGATSNSGFVPFYKALLLILVMIPIMTINIFIGLIFGAILNDKAAPGISSIFISLSGIIGGCWMPLETMGDFEKVCSIFPFYPSVYLGRCITHASHALTDELGNTTYYTFSDRGLLFIIITFAYLIVIGLLTLLFFNKRLKKDC